MRRFTLILAFMVAGLSAVLLSVGSDKRPANRAKPVSALIAPVGVASQDGVERREAIRISDPRSLAMLESFFPNYRQRPISDRVGGWVAGYTVYFDFPQGMSVRVTVSENENAAFWTVGSGDFNTQGDFKGFVEKLR